MNKSYKHVTNMKNGHLVTAVADETAQSREGSASSGKVLGNGKASEPGSLSKLNSFAINAITAGAMLVLGNAYAAAPVGTVASGTANLVTNGSVLTVNQTSRAATINFQQLNLARGEGVDVKAQAVSDITLLRVAGGMNVNGGFVTANNNLLISSPGGISVSNGGKVSAQGEVFMTTQDMAVGQYTKPTNQANTGVMNISGQSQISGSNIVLDAGSINLSNANIIATPVTQADGIRVQGGNVNVQSSNLSAVGGKIAIGVDTQGNYSKVTTVQGSNLVADFVQVAGKALNLDNTNSISAANSQIQSFDLGVNTGLAQLVSTLLSMGSNVVLIGDNSVTMAADSAIAANSNASNGLTVKTTGSTQNLPDAPAPSPNKIALSGSISLTGGRKYLVVNSAGDLDVDGANIQVDGDATFQALQAIVINGATISTIGDLVVGRDAYMQGALSQSTIVYNSNLTGYNIETSGDTLTTQGVSARTTGGQWLLDPTTINITNTASTGGSLTTALAATGASTINTVDIQNAINAGTNVNVVGSGIITLSSALTFTNNTANAATLTLDNTLGSKQFIHLKANITNTAGTNLVNVVIKSAGGQIIVGNDPTVSSTNGVINVKGDVTLDNTYAVNGTTSGFITQFNANTYAQARSSATNASQSTQSGIKNTAAITGKSITMNGVFYEDGPGSGSAVWIDANLSATNDIRLNGQVAQLANGASAVYMNNRPISVISTAGVIDIIGINRGLSSGVFGIGITFYYANATGINLTANKISIAGYANHATSTVGSTTTGIGVWTVGTSFTVPSAANYLYGGTAVSITGLIQDLSGTGLLLLTSNNSYTSTSGTGSVNINSNGGDVLFLSNSRIYNSLNTINVAKNSTGIQSKILYDTTSGANTALIDNAARVLVATGGDTAVNLIQKTNGAQIADRASASISVSGYVNIDNTNGSLLTPTISNRIGVSIAGALSAGALAGSTGLRINAISSGTGKGLISTAPLTALAGPVSLTATSATVQSIDLSAASTINSTVKVDIVGASSLASQLVNAYGSVSALGTISNSGNGGVTVQSTGDTVTGSITDSGAGGIAITGGYNIAAGTLTGGTITGVGTLTNTGGGVISLSMAQPTSATGGAIETAAGITTANASTADNVSYGNVGGVMGAVNTATVNSVNYRSILSGNTTINLTVGNYIQDYGTAYNGTVANSWLADVANTTISGITGSSSGFGVSALTNTQALSSLRFASNLGLAGNSNLVQSGTDISVSGAITSAYGTVVVAPVSGQNTYTIRPKILTITGSTATSIYDGVSTYAGLSALGTSYSGLVTSIGGVATNDAVTGLTRSIATSGGAAVTNAGVAQVGSYVDTLSSATGSGLSNYTINYVPGAFSVTPATLTIAGGSRTTTYNALSQNNATYTVTGLLGTDTVTAVSGVASGAAAGTYNDSLSNAAGTGLSNYSIGYTNGALTINKKTLTITSTSTSSTYTGAAQTGVYTVNGLAGTDSVSSLSGAATGTNAGSYSSTLGSAVGSTVGATNLSDNYAITYVNAGTLTITKANATLVGAVNTSTYSGSAQTNTGAVFTGLLGNDANSIGVSGYAVATHVAQGVVADNLSATGPLASNYNFTVTNGSFAITPKSLTIVGAQTTNVYNATTQTNTYSTSGLVTGDTISVTGSASARNVSTTNDNLVASFSAGSASDYTTTITNGWLKITPAIITVSGITASDKTYNGSTTATLNASGASYTGILGTDSVSLNTSSLTGAFVDANAGTNKTVLISGIGITGTDAANYQLSGGTTATTTATISPATLTVSGSNLTTTYNGGVQALAAPTVSGLVTGDNVVISGGASATNAGTYTTTYAIGGAGAANYTLSANAPVLTINKAALVVTADNNGKLVTQSDPTLTAQLSGLQGADTASSLGFTYSVGRVAGESASTTYAINATPTGATTLNNYTITYNPGVFTITPAGTVLIKMNPTISTYGTVTPGTIASVEYLTSTGSLLKTLTLKAGTTNVYTDGVGGEITITPTTTVTATTNAGSYVGAISNNNNGTLTSNNNFTAVQTIVNTATVNQANLVLTINPVTKTYDATAFTSAGATTTASGLMNGQTLASLGGVTYSGSAIGAIDASATPYTLLGSVGSGFSNYNVTIAPSSLTVNKAPLDITGATGIFNFNNTTRTNTYTVAGLQGTDAVTAVTGSGSGLHVATYNDVLSNAVGTGLSNYTIAYHNGSLVINPAQLYAIATPTNSPVYSGSTAVPNTTALTGIIAGTSVSGTTALSLSGAGVGTETIINAGTTLTGSNAGDYVVISSNVANTSTNQVTPNIVSSGNGGGTVVITPAPLLITGNTNLSYVFDNNIHTNTYTVSGLKGSDAVASVSGSGSNSHAGTYNDIFAVGSATGTGLSNYAITYVPGYLTITRAPLTALATPSAMTYNGSNIVANTTALSGIIAGTTVNGTTSLTIGAVNAGTQTITNNGTTLSGLNGGDYYVVSSNLVHTSTNQVTPTSVTSGNGGGTIVVDRAPLSVTGATTSTVYNGSTQTNTVSVSGLVSNELITTTGSAQATNVSDGTVADALVVVPGAGFNPNNYSIAITNGDLTLTPASLRIASTSLTQTYSGSAFSASYTTSGLVGSDAVTGVSGLATGSSIGTYSSSLSNAVGTGLSNYNITYVDSGALTIAAAPVAPVAPVANPAPVVTVGAAPVINQPYPIPYVLPPTPPVFVEPLDQVSDIVVTVRDINLGQDSSQGLGQGDKGGECGANPSVLFDFDSAVLTDEAKEQLRKCRFEPGKSISISGFTDGYGGTQYNVSLGERRAVAVQEFISDEFRIARGDIVIRSYGKTSPAYPNDTTYGRSKNRRVQLSQAMGR